MKFEVQDVNSSFSFKQSLIRRFQRVRKCIKITRKQMAREMMK